MLLTIVISVGVHAEEQKVYVIPAEKITKDQKYTAKDLQSIFNGYIRSYGGKALWGTFETPTDINMAVSGLAYKQGPIGSSSGVLAASCYRCGMGREDLVRKQDCEQMNYKWKVSSLNELKLCN